MDKETLSNYGWIVICVLVLAVMIALAGPFGNFVADAVKSTAQGLFDVNQGALDAAGIVIDDNGFADGENGGAGETPVVPGEPESPADPEQNEPQATVLSGVWVFNNNMIYPDGGSVYAYVNFHSTAFNDIYGEDGIYTLMLFTSEELYYQNTEEGYRSTPYTDAEGNYHGSAGWQTEDAKTVDFGTEIQEVPEDFYNWFTANATKIG